MVFYMNKYYTLRTQTESHQCLDIDLEDLTINVEVLDMYILHGWEVDECMSRRHDLAYLEAPLDVEVIIPPIVGVHDIEVLFLSLLVSVESHQDQDQDRERSHVGGEDDQLTTKCLIEYLHELLPRPHQDEALDQRQRPEYDDVQDLEVPELSLEIYIR